MLRVGGGEQPDPVAGGSLDDAAAAHGDRDDAVRRDGNSLHLCAVAGGRIQRVFRADDVLGVVTDHQFAGVAIRIGEHHAPRPPAIAAAPERGVGRIDDVRVHRVERKARHDGAEVDHAPRFAAVVGDVGAGHVASHQHHASDRAD